MDFIVWLQIIPLILASGAMLFEGIFDKNTEEDSRKKVRRIFSIIALGCTLVFILIGQRRAAEEKIRNDDQQQQTLAVINKQLEESQQIRSHQVDQIAQGKQLQDSQQQTIEGQKIQVRQSAELRAAQSQGIEEMTRLSLDRYMSGLEISYKPATAQWNAITRIYRTLKPSQKETSYYDAPIIAERVTDGWSVIFGWAKIIEGNKDMGWKMFPPAFASDKEEKGFASLIKEACIPLLIKWSDGTVTDIEPWTNRYPTVITISHDAITFTLRPPVLNLYLGALRQNAQINLRTRASYLSELRFKSLDVNVKCDQTIQLHWKKDDSNEPSDRVKPFTDQVELHPVFRIIPS